MLIIDIKKLIKSKKNYISKNYKLEQKQKKMEINTGLFFTALYSFVFYMSTYLDQIYDESGNINYEELSKLYKQFFIDKEERMGLYASAAIVSGLLCDINSEGVVDFLNRTEMEMIFLALLLLTPISEICDDYSKSMIIRDGVYNMSFFYNSIRSSHKLSKIYSEFMKKGCSKRLLMKLINNINLVIFWP